MNQQLQNLKSLLSLGEKLQSGAYPLNFGLWDGGKGDCETPACFLGWYMREQPQLRNNYFNPIDSKVHEHFGIGTREFNDLFVGNVFVTDDQRELAKRLAVLRELIASREPKHVGIPASVRAIFAESVAA